VIATEYQLPAYGDGLGVSESLPALNSVVVTRVAGFGLKPGSALRRTALFRFRGCFCCFRFLALILLLVFFFAILKTLVLPQLD